MEIPLQHISLTREDRLKLIKHVDVSVCNKNGIFVPQQGSKLFILLVQMHSSGCDVYNCLHQHMFSC